MSEDNSTNTGLMAQLDALVREHLPERVGANLREELQRLEQVEAENRTLKTRLEQAEKRADEHMRRAKFQSELDARANEIEQREKGLSKQEADLKVRTAVQEAIVEERDQRIADLKEVVHAVFGNNRFKYMRTMQHEEPPQPFQESDGYVSMHGGGPTTTTEDVEGEGDPPIR